MDSRQLEEVWRRAERTLEAEDYRLLRAIAESYVYVAELVEDQNASMRRLRQLFFGERSEKTEAIVGRNTEGLQNAAIADEIETDRETRIETAAADKAPPARSRGHGRNGADAYGGAERIQVLHPSLTAGDACPACGAGTVYEKAPGVLVRITGGPPLATTVYQPQKLRCHLCDQVFTAPAPTEAGRDKYDATAGSMIGLLKYGSGPGDLFMSLIYSCQLKEANPFDHLTQLQRHREQVTARPQLWTPWNYCEARR